MATSLFDSWQDAMLFRTLATLRQDVSVFEQLDDLRWTGPRPSFEELCRVMGARDLCDRAVSAGAKAAAQTA